MNDLKKIYMVILSALLFFSLLGSKKNKLDPLSREFYNIARYFMSKEEVNIFFTLPNKEERQKFISYFWEIRDPLLETEENEFREEIETRLEYVNKYLKEGPIPGWKSVRGRIYLQLGSPSHIDEARYISGKPNRIYWYYQSGSRLVRIVFIDTEGFGSYQLDFKNTSLSLMDLLRKRKQFISDRYSSILNIQVIDFKITYDKSKNDLILKIPLKYIYFEEEGLKKRCTFKIDLIVYPPKDKFFKRSLIKSVYVGKDILGHKKPSVVIPISISFPRGKSKVYALVRNMGGNVMGSKLKTIKVR
jgi:GWxTD domain-containing protein